MDSCRPRATGAGSFWANPIASRGGSGRLRRFILPVYLLSLRGFDSNRSAFYLSRQRHGAGMDQGRLHRHATAAVCGSCAPTKNPCRTKSPAPAFSLPHTTLSQSQAWSLRVLFFIPRPLAGRICACMRRPFVRLHGVALRCSFPAHLPRFPSPCRARVRWQAHTVSQAHGMPCETPAQPPRGSP